jgi:hypothetical protein
MAAKPKPAEPMYDPAPTKAAVEQAIEVSEGVTASAELAPKSAPQGEETVEQAIARIRAIRQPFGNLTQKLALPKRAGYHRHWFNDVAGRIDEALTSGWSHIMNPRDGKPLKRAVGTGRDNGVLNAYAMELPEIFWQEEMDARHKQASEKIDAIKKQPFRSAPGQAKASDTDKFYSPAEGTTGPLSITKG